ncbi:MAG: hypothetical protein QOJ50_2036 [Cryptosporangiaceae bacterium]|nr:hypothetical protein [Cryptosporangiaceae bacterium]
MLDPDELANTAAAFGVSDEQVRRDHLISHILSALGTLDAPLLFFGGTALARTHLADPMSGGRLSEDIDLCTSDRASTAALLTEQLPRRLRREFPGTIWAPSLSSVRAVQPAQLVAGDLRVRIQLLDGEQHREIAAWPSETTTLDMRYSDVPRTTLTVPTAVSFVGMKTVAWMDRATARDLYDLARLAEQGAITREVSSLIHRITGWEVAPYCFASAPAAEWQNSLSHQTRSLSTAEQCLHAVKAAFAAALKWADD